METDVLDPGLTLIVLVLLFMLVFLVESKIKKKKGEQGLAKEFLTMIAEAIKPRSKK